MDTSRVLEHGTSGYVRILEEYGSVSCDFRTTILLISHSVTVRYNLMPHRVYIKDIESSRNVSVITSSVKKKKHFIQAHGQKYIYISISLEYINT